MPVGAACFCANTLRRRSSIVIDPLFLSHALPPPLYPVWSLLKRQATLQRLRFVALVRTHRGIRPASSAEREMNTGRGGGGREGEGVSKAVLSVKKSGGVVAHLSDHKTMGAFAPCSKPCDAWGNSRHGIRKALGSSRELLGSFYASRRAALLTTHSGMLVLGSLQTQQDGSSTRNWPDVVFFTLGLCVLRHRCWRARRRRSDCSSTPRLRARVPPSAA